MTYMLGESRGDDVSRVDLTTAEKRNEQGCKPGQGASSSSLQVVISFPGGERKWLLTRNVVFLLVS